MQRKRIHSIPTLNTSSTADISFMLLIFFLLTTSMDADMGLVRQLPPTNDAGQQVQVDVNSQDVLSFLLTAEGDVTVNGETIPPEQIHTRATDFILQKGQKHLIAIASHPDARYDLYFALQNQLAQAYREARDQWAKALFGKPFAECSPAEQETVGTELPQRVAEVYDAQKGGLQ